MVSVKKVVALNRLACHIVFMSEKSLYTQEDLRAELRAKLRGRKQIDVAKEIGVNSNHLSQVCTGNPINGAILIWLGYEKCKPYYRRITK